MKGITKVCTESATALSLHALRYPLARPTPQGSAASAAVRERGRRNRELAGRLILDSFATDRTIRPAG
jgi:hypothetical protein